MSEVDPVISTIATHWSMMHREGDSISLLECDNFNSRLHSRALLYQYKFASDEVAARFRQ